MEMVEVLIGIALAILITQMHDPEAPPRHSWFCCSGCQHEKAQAVEGTPRKLPLIDRGTP